MVSEIKMNERCKKYNHYPKTALEALKIWDKGEILWSVEMGGLGPSYEQSIQFSIFELVRYFKGIAPKGNMYTINKRMDEALAKIDKRFDIGHSGATAGASKDVAYKFMKYGYNHMMKKAPKSRIIQVEKKITNFSEVKSK